jgi:hypothetical protein
MPKEYFPIFHLCEEHERFFEPLYGIPRDVVKSEQCLAPPERLLEL